MTKTAIIIAMIFSFSLAVCGQEKKTSGFVEFQTTSTDSGTTPQINLLVERPVTKKVKLWGYAMTTLKSKGNYNEAYGGIAVSPKPWFEAGVALGVESPGKARLGAYVWAGKGHVGNLLLLEGLGSGLWYKNTTTFSVAKAVKVGLKVQRFKGAGPHVEYDIPHTPFKLWATLFLVGKESHPIAQFGVRYSFKF